MSHFFNVKTLESDIQVVVVAAVTAVCLLGDSLLYVVLPLSMNEFGLDNWWEVGVLLSINRLIRIPLHPVIGWFYKTNSIFTGLLIALVLTGFSTFSYGAFEGFWVLALMRSMWGAAFALLKQGGQLIVIKSLDHNGFQAGKMAGLYNGISRIGSLAGIVAGVILTPLIGLITVFYVFSLCILVAVPLLVILFERPVESKAEFSVFGDNRLFNSMPVIVKRALFTGGLSALSYQGIMNSSLSLWLKNQDFEPNMVFHGMGAITGAVLLQAARWSWEPFVAPWLGVWTDRNQHRVPTLKYTLLLAMILFILIPLPIPTPFWFLIAVGLLLSATVVTTLLDAEISAVASMINQRQAIVAAYTTTVDIGAGFGPLIGYFTLQWFDSSIVCWIAALFLAISVVVWSQKNQFHDNNLREKGISL